MLVPYSWFQMLWYFYIYGFLGWCSEVAFAAVAHGFARSQIVAYRFTREQVSLEQAYMELTHAHAQYVSAPMTAAGAQIPQNMPMQNMPVQNMGNGGAR